MENEKYGISLELLISKFKQGLQQASEMVKNFGKEAEQRTTIQPEIEIKGGYEKQIEYVKDQMDAVMDQINAIKFGGKAGNLNELEVEYEKLSNKLTDLTAKQEEFNNELEETGEKANNINLGQLFDKSISKIKRFTFYLLGARSVFSLFMKYQSIYYQYNEQMRYQSELSQNAIALSLAPAFEVLGNVITYTSIAFAKFIELLTGIPILSKVSTKGIRDYNKALKESQTLVSGIDEITNLTLPSSTGLASQYKALDDFQKKVAEVTKWFDENTWISDTAKGIRDVYDYVSEHWDVLKYVLGGAVLSGIMIKIGASLMGVGTALGTVASVGSIASAGTGLAGLGSMLAYIGGLGIIATEIAIGISTYVKNDEDYEKLKEDIAKPKDFKVNFDKIVTKIKEARNKLKLLDKDSKDYKTLVNLINTDWDNVTSSIMSGDEEILNNLDDAKDLAKELSKLTDDDTYNKTFDLAEKIGLQKAEENSRSFLQVWLGGLLGVNEVRKRTYQELMDEFNEANDKLHSVEDTANDVKKSLDETFKDRVMKLSLNYNLDKNSVMNLIKKVKGLSTLPGLGMASSTFDNLANKILRSFGYAKGLDYVPYDNYPAILHKGEAVVPAQYNPSIHGLGNDYTNSLLETVVMKLDDLANRPNVIEVDGKKFANATYSYYQEAGNRQNYVEGVVAR